VGADAVALGLDAQVLTDLSRAGFLLGGGPGQADSVGAGLIEFPGARAKRAHVK
jgi:hypothetical protein